MPPEPSDAITEPSGSLEVATIRAWPAPRNGWPTVLSQVSYTSSAIPGTNTPPSSWLEGSNCQSFAYGVLSLFGLTCPPLRSSELWNDIDVTAAAEDPRPLDLVLFNATDDPFGAHVGLWMAPDEILHLCGELGRPAVWPLAAFAARPRYATLIGFKRVTALAT